MKRKGQMRKLEKQNIEDIFALTAMQEGMLFHYLKDPTGDYYFEQLSLELSGAIDSRLFEKAWNFVIETNEMLRAVFRWEKVENPIQIILTKHHLQPIYYDLSRQKSSEKEKQVERIKSDDRKNKFDLRGLAFRVTLCKLENSKYVMIISNHHILYDGWSNGILLKEFFDAYNDLSQKKVPRRPTKNKFKEFVKWFQTRDSKKQEKFWKEYLEGYDSQTGFSLKRRRKKETKEIENHQFRFNRDKKYKLERFVKNYKITLASLLYSAWGILLQRYNNSEDVIFGTTVSGRSAKVNRIEKIVGVFINTLPLRVNNFSNEKISGFILRINKILQAREKYESTSLVNIKRHINVNINEDLFDTLMVIENYPLDTKVLEKGSKLSINSYYLHESTNYDLSIRIRILSDIEIGFSYNSEFFDLAAIEKMFRHFSNIIKDLIDNPGKVPYNINILSEDEKNQILYKFNDTGVVGLGKKTIHELFQEQVRRTPNSPAVSFKDMKVTYRKLDSRANSLAGALREKGVKPEVIVGIIMERTIEMVVGLLGILKAGGVYLPIDPEYPQERIKYILVDSNTGILLVQSNLLYQCEAIGFGGESIDPSDNKYCTESKEELNNLTTPNNLVYIIYTSGSTGRPKGVMVEHRSASSLVKNTNYINFKEGERLLMTGSIVFDVTTFEIWGALLNGLYLFLIGKNVLLNFKKLKEHMLKHKISVLHLVPQLFNQLVMQYPEIFAGLKYFLVGGDVVRPKLLNLLRNKYTHINITHAYGPTENTTFSTTLQVEKDYEEGLPIGKPISNSTVYVLGKNKSLQPVGVVGELYTGGSGVSRGYLNRVELTKEKFIPHPFVPREKLYRTGDLSRWLSDGNIEFLGRMDHQVKIRGFRIELGEIESQLLKKEAIKEAVVLAKEDDRGVPFICAYIAADLKFDAAELKKYLFKYLPNYMIPSYFIQIDKFPLTPNGKVDKKSLPDAEVKPVKEYTAPKSGKEKIIANTWKNVLNLDKVSIYDNFFDIGGNSLNIIQVNSKLQEALEMEISIEKMFEYPTINSLANYLMLAEGDTCTTDKEIEHIDSIYDEAMHIMENAMQIIGEE